MKKLLFIILLSSFFGSLLSQNMNMTLLGNMTFNSTTHGRLSDVWGYVDTAGNEYAIVGVQKGVSIVDVTNPKNMFEVFYAPGPTTIWRDIKTWDKHAYITNESSGGMMIIDMSALPGAITTSDVYNHIGTNTPFIKAHNLFIDEKGFAYIFGSNYSARGAVFLDLKPNPKIPTEVGVFDSLYFHDGMVRGDTLWGAAVYAGAFFAIDVSNKANPVIMRSHSTSGNFAHNCWISNDGKTLFTTDEISGGAVGSYDVSDFNNIDEMDLIWSNPGSGVIPHNSHVYGDFVITSYYRDGVTIIDASQPDRMVQVGNYDTSPLFGNGFNGAWGAYPYLPSENVLVSDIENGLFVLGADYVKGVYLQGRTKQFSDSATIPIAKINILNIGDSLTSNLIGGYKESFVDSGLYKIAFSKPGYFPDTVDIFMKSGQMHTVDVYLRSKIPFKLSGHVRDFHSTAAIENADVLIQGKYSTYAAKTDAQGYFELTTFFEGSYEVSAGKWNYQSNCYDLTISKGDTLSLDISKAVYDDFTFDNGWTTIDSGINGFWEREDFYREADSTSLDYPVKDLKTDCSHHAYVTGVSSRSDHDVDGGWNYLISPSMDASGYKNPMLLFSYWFRNDAASGSEDSLIFSLISNADTSLLLNVNNSTNLLQSQWVDTSVLLPTNGLGNFQLLVKVGDFGNDDLLEAGIDEVQLVEAFVGVPLHSESNGFKVFPNPSYGTIFYEVKNDFSPIGYKVFDLNGRVSQEGLLNSDQRKFELGVQVKNGLNLIQFSDENGKVLFVRFVRMD